VLLLAVFGAVRFFIATDPDCAQEGESGHPEKREDKTLTPSLSPGKGRKIRITLGG